MHVYLEASPGIFGKAYFKVVVSPFHQVVWFLENLFLCPYRKKHDFFNFLGQTKNFELLILPTW